MNLPIIIFITNLTFMHTEQEKNVLVKRNNAISWHIFSRKLFFFQTMDQILCFHDKLQGFYPFYTQSQKNVFIIKKNNPYFRIINENVHCLFFKESEQSHLDEDRLSILSILRFIIDNALNKLSGFVIVLVTVIPLTSR